MSKRSLYVSRAVKNADDVIAWAKGQGFTATVPAEEMHVTVAFSREPVEWDDVGDSFDEILIPAAGEQKNDAREVKPLGDKGAVVLRFENAELTARWQEIVDAGASWDWPGYQPHVTISYAANGVDPGAMEPYVGQLILGPERFAEVDDDWTSKITEKRMTTVAGLAEAFGAAFAKAFGLAKAEPCAADVHADKPMPGKPKKKPPEEMTKATIVKTDDEARMVYGWASVITEKGVAVVDTQGDIIEADELVKATTAFMADARLAKAMHTGEGVGEVLHSFPLTAELAKSLGITCDREGWLVGVKVADDAVWKRVKSGDLRAFSIGGGAERVEVDA